MQTDVADALAVDLEVHVVVRIARIDDVGPAIAAHDAERRRYTELELGRSEVDAERADERRGDDVVDGVGGSVAVEVEEMVSPVRDEAERELFVAERLRCVDREVAARVDRRLEGVETDISGGVGRRDRRTCENRERERQATGKADGHVASGT